jgi:cell division protein FtsB
MAIEIVPKEVAKPSPLQKILLYLAISLLLVAILSYLVLNFYLIKKANQRLSELEVAIKKEKTPQHLALEEEMKNYQKKIKDFSQLLLAHRKSSNFFEFLEKKNSSKSLLFRGQFRS